jgi:hypothetical protein
MGVLIHEKSPGTSPMMLDKREYLSRRIVRDFVDYLTSLLNGTPLHHTYRRRKEVFSIHNLEEAFASYDWKGDYELNRVQLDAARERAIRAIAVEGREVVCKTSTMPWMPFCCGGAGGQSSSSLYRSNIKWAKKVGADLVSLLRAGRETMVSDQPDFTNFSNGVRMNAGLTKYYALACDNVIIYDGRVGAALCLLVRYFLEGKGDSAPQDVPGELAFRWGAQNARRGRARPRDPSSTRYKFSPLAYASDREWARCNVLADWVLTEARARASAS